MAKTNVHQQVIAVSKSYHDTVEIYIKNFIKLAGITLIPNLLTYFLLISLKASVISAAARLVNLGDFFSLTNVNFVVSLLLLATIAIVQIIGLVALTYMSVHHERVSILSSFEHSLEFFWRFVGLGIVLMLIAGIGLLIGSLFIILIGSPIASTSVESFNSVFGWLTFIPLTLSAILSTFFIFAGYSIVDKNHSITKGLQHSFHLVFGHFWPVVVRALLVYVVTTILLLAIQMIPQIGDTISVMLVAPFSVVYLFILYQDLTKIKA